MANAGIDYSLGRSNFDTTNGIHFGVISSHSVDPESPWNDAEGNYGKPHCPSCGNEIKASDDETLFAEGTDDTPDWFDGKDFTCVACESCYWSDSVYSEEALGYTYEDGEYNLTDCLQSDIFVLKSPYYTFAQFCSPCVPGAGNLDNPREDGPKTYALGHQWFDGDKAPYRVFSVATGLEVLPD